MYIKNICLQKKANAEELKQPYYAKMAIIRVGRYLLARMAQKKVI